MSDKKDTSRYDLVKICDELFFLTGNIGFRDFKHVLTMPEKEFEEIYGKEKLDDMTYAEEKEKNVSSVKNEQSFEM